MKTLKAIKHNEGYLFVDIDADPFPLGLHLKKNEILMVQGVGEKSGEVFHSKGFNYKNEVAKIVGQYNLNLPHIYYVDIDLDFFDIELRELRELASKADNEQVQDRILSQCDTVINLKRKFKSSKTRKYTEDDLLEAFRAGAKIGTEDTTAEQVLEAMENLLHSLPCPTIASIDIQTMFVVPQENGTRSDGKITDEISLNPKFNTLEVPTVYYKYGKEHLTLININYENLHHTED